MMSRVGSLFGLSLMAAALFPAAAYAQHDRPAESRAEVIERERREKVARLWPERQSPIAEIANGFIARGLLDGVREGYGGGNGLQFVLGGMRSGQGLSVGVGYRRSDLFNEKLGFRTTVRGTPELAWMADLQVYFPPLYTQRGFLDLYFKYEWSPQMDYYGEGQRSSLDDRSSYALEDFRSNARGGWEFFDYLRVGGILGNLHVRTGPGQRSGVPSIQEVFDPSEVPGLFIPGEFFQTGLFVQLDWRDNPGGPREGGHWMIEWNQYWDYTDEDQFNFRRADVTIDQYFPYFNKTRVFAFHLHGAFTWTDPGQQVPFYLQPYLGGNDDLRGFARYRFYDDNSLWVVLEHRWHSFSGMDVALFVDAGKVSPQARTLYRERLRWDAGIGLRFKMLETVIMRIDQAISEEGYRFMWTFSNIF